MTLRLTRRQRNVLIACAAVGAGGYITHRIYTSSSVVRKRRQLYNFFASLTSLLDAASKGGDCAGLLCKDLHAFLLTDADEVPQSLKQLLKIGQTREFQRSIAALCRAVTQGVVSSGEGGKGKSRSQGDRRVGGESKAEGLPERLVGKLFSEAGKGFASTIVANASRSLVLSVLEVMQERKVQDITPKAWSSTDWSPEAWIEESAENGLSNIGISQDSLKKPAFNASASGDSVQETLLELASSSRGKALIADCIETFVGTAVSVYLAKTRDVNFYDDMIASVVQPTHRAPMKELLTSVCNGAMETFIRTSHEVISGSSRSEPGSSVVAMDSPLAAEKSVFKLDKTSYCSDSGHPQQEDDETMEKAAESSKSWVGGISRTLAVPSNRALVLDVAGTMTHEAVRSAIEVVTEKVTMPFRSKKNAPPKDEKPSTSTVAKIVTKTGDLALATASKAMVVMTMCVALCLHTLVGVSTIAQPRSGAGILQPQQH